MVEIELTYQGELRNVATHGPSNAQLNTDAPVDNHGRGESFSPTDLVATALGGCVLTIMGIKAQDKGWALEGARARVEKHMSSDLPRRINRIVLEVSLPKHLEDDQIALLEKVGLQCPVMQSLHPDIDIEHNFTKID